MVSTAFSSGGVAEAPHLLPRISTPHPIAQRRHARVYFSCHPEVSFYFGELINFNAVLMRFSCQLPRCWWFICRFLQPLSPAVLRTAFLSTPDRRVSTSSAPRGHSRGFSLPTASSVLFLFWFVFRSNCPKAHSTGKTKSCVLYPSLNAANTQ